MSSDKKDDEMICALTVDEYGALQTGLRELSDTMPPRAVWNRIRRQAEAEGLVVPPVARRRTTWFAGAGLAAAAVLAAVMLPRVVEQPVDAYTVPENLSTNSTQLSALQTLMVESRQLENNLRALPEEPRVMRATTVASISDLEDRIAAIDYQLNDPSTRMSPEDRELFWRERVRLMKSLLQLRYAQAQRAAF